MSSIIKNLGTIKIDYNNNYMKFYIINKFIFRNLLYKNNTNLNAKKLPLETLQNDF